MKNYSPWILWLGILLTSLSAYSQVETGVPAFSTVQNMGIDTINVANLNSHLAFPIVNKPGRGLPFYYTLSYDSSVWVYAIHS